MFGDLSGVIWSAGHSPHLDRRRAAAILARVHAFSVLFAILTLAFVALDAMMLSNHQWRTLAAGRIVAATAFVGLALWTPRAAPVLSQAIPAMVALFAVPAGFAIFAHDVLHQGTGADAAHFLYSAYSFVPFLLACGIAAFPVTALEAAALAMLAFADELWFLYGHDHRGTPLLSMDALWLLLLVAAISTFAAASQVRLLGAVVRQMIRDPLTGCLRRESGQEVLDTQLALALRQRAPLTIMFADLDHFKRVNDEFGHEAGDSVLKQAAASLIGAVRESDSVLRWGGEEFVVVLPNTTSADAVKLLERLRRRGIARQPDGVPVTLSVGLAETLQDGITTAEALVELADRRMYHAKQSGRNRYVAPQGGPMALLA